MGLGRKGTGWLLAYTDTSTFRRLATGFVEDIRLLGNRDWWCETVGGGGAGVTC